MKSSTFPSEQSGNTAHEWTMETDVQQLTEVASRSSYPTGENLRGLVSRSSTVMRMESRDEKWVLQNTAHNDAEPDCAMAEKQVFDRGCFRCTTNAKSFVGSASQFLLCRRESLRNKKFFMSRLGCFLDNFWPLNPDSASCFSCFQYFSRYLQYYIYFSLNI